MYHVILGQLFQILYYLSMTFSFLSLFSIAFEMSSQSLLIGTYCFFLHKNNNLHIFLTLILLLSKVLKLISTRASWHLRGRLLNPTELWNVLPYIHPVKNLNLWSKHSKKNNFIVGPGILFLPLYIDYRE